MAIAWMWGFEAGTQLQAYANTGWALDAPFNLADGNGEVAVRSADTHQPASGFGGGRYCLAMGYMNGTAQEVVTPANGPGSFGPFPRGVFHMSYRRRGVTAPTIWGELFALRSGQDYAQSLIAVRHANTGEANVSGLALWVKDASSETMVLRATSTTTYTGTQPYHRIVVEWDGVAGSYVVYVNGIEEMRFDSAGHSFALMGDAPGEYTAGIDVLALRGGARVAMLNFPWEADVVGGSRMDHLVIWDGGNHSTGDLEMVNRPLTTETVVVGGKTYTFQSTLTNVDGNVYYGLDVGEAIRNLVNAINLGPGAGTQYATLMTLNSVVRAEADASLFSGNGGVHVIAKVNGAETGAISDGLTQGTDGWGGAAPTSNLAGGDLDNTNDKALALGDIFIQGLLPNQDVTDGSFLNVNGTNDGTNVDMFANLNDGDNLTDFVQTVTSPDSIEIGVENRGDIDGTAATATLTVSGVITTGDQVVIGGQTYILVSPFVDTANNIDASGTNAQTMENTRRAINGDGVAGTNYGTGTPVNVDVTATDTPTTVVATAKRKGTPGDGIVTTTTGANLSWGAGMAGGAQNWTPSAVHAMQSVQIQRASGAISTGRSTLEIPSLGQITSDSVNLLTAGKLIPTLREWRTADATTDVDGIKTGTEV